MGTPRILRLLLAIGFGCLLVACKPSGQAPQVSPMTKNGGAQSLFKLDTGIKEIMAYMIDPAADALWGAVSVEETAKGIVNHQPKTDVEWAAIRGHAIELMEGANLIVMDGRRVAMAGHELEDQGTPGNLTAAESQRAIDTDRASFIGFAHALHDVGLKMYSAAEEENPQGLVDAGDTLDQVCEGCHLKFWYPGQNIPPFPGQAPEMDAAAAQSDPK